MPSDYPCYGLTSEEQAAMRTTLNQMIVRHYLMREIGYETYELWQIMMETKLMEIMPYYQELYKTTLFELDLDNPYHMVTEHTEEGNDQRQIGRNGDSNTEANATVGEKTDSSVETSENVTASGEENNKTTSKNAHSDFPQASFSNGDYASWAEEGSGSSDTDTSSTSKTSGSETTDANRNVTSSDTSTGSWKDYSQDNGEDFMHYLHDVKGHTNNKEILDAIEKWRDLIININEMIIKELENMFILLYN